MDGKFVIDINGEYDIGRSGYEWQDYSKLSKTSDYDYERYRNISQPSSKIEPTTKFNITPTFKKQIALAKLIEKNLSLSWSGRAREINLTGKTAESSIAYTSGTGNWTGGTHLKSGTFNIVSQSSTYLYTFTLIKELSSNLGHNCSYDEFYNIKYLNNDGVIVDLKIWPHFKSPRCEIHYNNQVYIGQNYSSVTDTESSIITDVVSFLIPLGNIFNGATSVSIKYSNQTVSYSNDVSSTYITAGSDSVMWDVNSDNLYFGDGYLRLIEDGATGDYTLNFYLKSVVGLGYANVLDIKFKNNNGVLVQALVYPWSDEPSILSFPTVTGAPTIIGNFITKTIGQNTANYKIEFNQAPSINLSSVSSISYTMESLLQQTKCQLNIPIGFKAYCGSIIDNDIKNIEQLPLIDPSCFINNDSVTAIPRYMAVKTDLSTVSNILAKKLRVAYNANNENSALTLWVQPNYSDINRPIYRPASEWTYLSGRTNYHIVPNPYNGSNCVNNVYHYFIPQEGSECDLTSLEGVYTSLGAMKNLTLGQCQLRASSYSSGNSNPQYKYYRLINSKNLSFTEYAPTSLPTNSNNVYEFSPLYFKFAPLPFSVDTEEDFNTQIKEYKDRVYKKNQGGSGNQTYYYFSFVSSPIYSDRSSYYIIAFDEGIENTSTHQENRCEFAPSSYLNSMNDNLGMNRWGVFSWEMYRQPSSFSLDWYKNGSSVVTSSSGDDKEITILLTDTLKCKHISTLDSTDTMHYTINNGSVLDADIIMETAATTENDNTTESTTTTDTSTRTHQFTISFAEPGDYQIKVKLCNHYDGDVEVYSRHSMANKIKVHVVRHLYDDSDISKYNDFTGFEFNYQHSSSFNLVRTSDGSRYNNKLLPSFTDETVQKVGGDGTYYFNTNYNNKEFNIQVAFDSLTEEQYFDLNKWLEAKTQGYLVFDESPYKKYKVKVKDAPEFKTVCFNNYDDPITQIIGETTTIVGYNRVYKGEGTINFICYEPFAESNTNYLDQCTYTSGSTTLYQPRFANINEWKDSLNLKQSYNAALDESSTANLQYFKLYNAGDIEADLNIVVDLNYAIDEDQELKFNKVVLTQIINNQEITKASFTVDTALGVMEMQDPYINFNFKTRLIEGISGPHVAESITGTTGSSGTTNQNQIKTCMFSSTGNLYNSYMTAGDFFKLPIGETRLKFYKDSTLVQPYIEETADNTTTYIPFIYVFFNHLYY